LCVEDHARLLGRSQGGVLRIKLWTTASERSFLRLG
jgi:hypothetical protein